MGFGNVRARVQRRQIHQDLVAGVSLVCDDFLDHAGVLVCCRGHSFEVLGGRRHRVRDGRGTPLVGALDRHPDDDAGLQVDRVLDLVREVRLDTEYAKLKRMYADLALENAAIKDVLAREL